MRKLELGDKVVNTSPDNTYNVPMGEIGTVTEVDISDIAQTYRVKWPDESWSLWWYNSELEPFRNPPADEETVCGWQARALKAELELAELKNALKTLSEG
jgi:hypothetical protein